MIDSQKSYDELVRCLVTAAQLPVPKAVLKPGDTVKCMGCKKSISVADIRQYRMCRSRHIDYTDVVCDDCQRSLGKMVRLVCVGCKEVVLRINPHKDTDGFTFSSAEVYHLDKCPVCHAKKTGQTMDPNLVSMVIEKHIWLRQRK